MTIHITPGEDLQAVLDAAEEGALICLAPGTYRCKTVIRTRNLTLRGAGADKTRIVWDDYAKKIDDQGREYVTFRTYTMAVCAQGVTLEDLCVENDAGRPEEKGQEVALTVYAGGFRMKNCALISTQDTLFSGPLPPDLIERYDGFLADELRRAGQMDQYFENCLIQGTVDFIFGCGRTVFDRCELRSGFDVRGTGFVAAPAHGSEQKEGFLFRRCRLTCQEGVRPGSVYLARPWRDYGLARFEACTYGPHIAPEGFDKWNATHRDRTARFFETPPVPGRVSWINRETEATGEATL